jgi:hypothetical protein
MRLGSLEMASALWLIITDEQRWKTELNPSADSKPRVTPLNHMAY